VNSESEVAQIVSKLLSGVNVLLVGPNHAMIRELLEGVRGQLGLQESARSGFVIMESITAQEALGVMCGQNAMILCASMPYLHVFGTTVAFAEEIQRRTGAHVDRILDEALKGVRCVGFSSQAMDAGAKSSFREKLEEAKYNQAKLSDHSKLLRAWTSEGEQCDPGWELDR
jgi:hypothetical protein